MVERTLAFIKPDGVSRQLVGRIIQRFEDHAIHITHMKMIRMTPELADIHYAEHKDKPFYPSLKEYVTSGPIIVLILEGENIVSITRKLVGVTNSAEAKPGTIRGDFSIYTQYNIMHASDSHESAIKEIEHFMPYLK